MATIDQLAGEAALETDKNIAEELLGQPEHGAGEFIDPPDQPQGIRLNLGFLMKETGPGEIEDYIEHPLNFNQSKGIAQVIRGVAGFVGNGSQLRLAVLDIVFGLNRFRKGGDAA